MAPLQGELSAQLTEGFRLGLQAKSRRRRNARFSAHPGWYSAFSEGFSKRKAGTPQSRLTPSQLPFQGSPSMYFQPLPPGTPPLV